jgi:hypothetical protein
MKSDTEHTENSEMGSALRLSDSVLRLILNEIHRDSGHNVQHSLPSISNQTGN